MPDDQRTVGLVTSHARDPSCVFCQIVAGEAPAVVVARGRSWVAFAPDHPATLGHTLIVPSKHARDLLAIPRDEAASLFGVAHDLCQPVIDAVGATGVNVLTAAGAAAEQSIFHLHIHVLPRHEHDGVSLWPETQPDYSSSEIEDVSARIAAGLTRQDVRGDDGRDN